MSSGGLRGILLAEGWLVLAAGVAYAVMTFIGTKYRWIPPVVGLLSAGSFGLRLKDSLPAFKVSIGGASASAGSDLMWGWWMAMGASLLVLLYGAFGDALRNRLRGAGAIFAGLMLTAVGGVFLAFVQDPSRFVPLAALGVTFVAGAVFLYVFGAAAADWDSDSSLALLGAALGIALLQFSSGRAPASDPLRPLLLDPVNLKEGLALFFAVGGAAAVFGLLSNARTFTFGAFGAFALAFALWFSWSHWVDLSHHWTQRDQFWRYYAQRKPGEPITAFLMNWRGETFYSRNTVKQIKENARLTAYANQPGREWALVEHYRYNILKNAVGPDKTVTMVDRDLNNKFVLVTIDGP